MIKALTLAIAAFTSVAVLGQTKPTAKKLLEFGWDEPNTAFMRTHIAEMEQTPFDGTVFTIEGRDKDGKTLNFLAEAWG